MEVRRHERRLLAADADGRASGGVELKIFSQQNASEYLKNPGRFVVLVRIALILANENTYSPNHQSWNTARIFHLLLRMGRRQFVVHFSSRIRVVQQPGQTPEFADAPNHLGGTYRADFAPLFHFQQKTEQMAQYDWDFGTQPCRLAGVTGWRAVLQLEDDCRSAPVRYPIGDLFCKI